MLRALLHVLVFALLTVLTQVGGLVWLVAGLFQRRLLGFVLLYALTLGAVGLLAPQFGRVPLSCVSQGPLQVQSWVYCALARNYVSPELRDVLEDVAAAMDRQHPGTETLVLDANFPFFDGFPLLPHLSHHDGEKVDLAFYYQGAGGYLPGKTRAPLGYFAFEQGPTDCPARRLSLRWDMDALQPLWADYALDEDRTRDLMRVLKAEPRVGKVFLEPHLSARLGVAGGKVRFQGCRAARHDDHIHLQL